MQKKVLFEVINARLKGPRARYKELMGDDVPNLEVILREGALRAQERTAALLG